MASTPSINFTLLGLAAETVLGSIDWVEKGGVGLLSSETPQLETEKNPNPLRRRCALEVLGLATWDVEGTE